MKKSQLKQIIKECITEINSSVPSKGEILAMQQKASELTKTIANKSARDEGTCVLGAGVAVWTGTGKGSAILARAPYQGNVGSYNYLLPVLKEMQKLYPQYEISWYDGVMD
jgi:hypothetical protein